MTAAPMRDAVHVHDDHRLYSCLWLPPSRRGLKLHGMERLETVTVIRDRLAHLLQAGPTPSPLQAHASHTAPQSPPPISPPDAVHRSASTAADLPVAEPLPRVAPASGRAPHGKLARGTHVPVLSTTQRCKRSRCTDEASAEGGVETAAEEPKRCRGGDDGESAPLVLRARRGSGGCDTSTQL